LFLGRFFGPVRTPAILLAGLTRMPVASYVAWCGLADLLWVGAWQLALLHFGRVAQVVWDRFGTRAAGVAFAVLLAVALAVLGWRLTRGRP
jgi:membrane protein DedA with SNARE-associated domain